ncbi:MAG: protein kinase [Myxococcota bacterium]|nr:protein kinase [Myxococcota bacterium]
MARDGTVLGPFRLTRVIGQGAMGVVWEAQHRARRKRVAVKLLHEGSLRDDWAVASFQKEVRAQAGLSHSGIVRVLDHGVVEEGSHRLPKDSPFLVMELIDGGPLHTYTGRMSWPRLRDVLLQLLDALSHSHARGVIHRDLKPGNVLVLEELGQMPLPTGSGPFRITLTDFGLAQAVDRGSPADGVVAGTPAYMAPEQLYGLWRDQGPWTDLYSVGCMAWALATGEPPFGRKRPVAEFRDMHLRAPPPAFRPLNPVPRGFEAWLRRLLEKRPSTRFNRAAEAAFALLGIEGGAPGSGGLTSGSVQSLAGDKDQLRALMTQAIEALDEATGVLPLDAIEPLAAPAPALQPGQPLPRVRVPSPPGWAHPRPPRHPEPLPGVGLNLVALRESEVVGRSSERDALWAELREVHSSLSQRAVLLQGPAGCGRSRLGTWLCERADEVGAATALHASHTKAGEGDGVVGMLARHLRAAGLTRQELLDRLRPQGELATPLAELVQPSGELGFSSRRERFGVILRYLEQLSRPLGPLQKQVPVVLVLDDVHWSQEALAFAQHLLESVRSVPILLVLITQDEALAELPAARGALTKLARSPRCATLRVEALPAADHRAMLREVLGMDQAVVDAVASRTSGNPKFALQLVEDWAERRLLEAAPGGYRLRRGVTMDLPPDLQSVWKERVQRVLSERTAEAAQALELAAVMGEEIALSEWRQACELAKVSIPADLLEELRKRRLIQDTGDDGLRFSNVMLREALLNQARERKRSHHWHKACAQVLQRRADHGLSVPERLGKHLLLSGQPEPALQILLDGGKAAVERAELDAAARQLQTRERAMKRLRVPMQDPRWGEGWLAQAFLLFFARRYEQGDTILRRAEAGAERFGWRMVKAQALRERSRFERRNQDLPAAAKALREALRLAPDDPELAASSRLGLGAVLLLQGNTTEARQLLEQAHQDYQWEGKLGGMADCELHLARCDIQQGALDSALERIQRARSLYSEARSSWKAAECLNMLGEISRSKGDLAGAESWYREAAQALEAVGHPDPYLPQINLGLVLSEKGEYGRARAVLLPKLKTLERGRSPMMVATLHLALLTPSAHLGEWGAWDRHLETARRVLSESGYVDIENAQQAQRAGESAQALGERDRARRVWRVALEQYRALGREAEMAAARDALAELH